MIKKGYVLRAQDKLLKIAYAAHGATPHATATHAALTALLPVSAEDAEMTEEGGARRSDTRFLLANTTSVPPR